MSIVERLKRLTVEALLESEPNFLVSLNVLHPAVRLPPHVRHNAVRFPGGVEALSLMIGHELVVPIPDLVVDDFGITATLSFGRTPYLCRIPWESILGCAKANGLALVAFNPGPLVEEQEPVMRRRMTLQGKRKYPKLSLVPPVDEEREAPGGA